MVSGDVVGVLAVDGAVQVSGDNIGEIFGLQEIGDTGKEGNALFASDVLKYKDV